MKATVVPKWFPQCSRQSQIDHFPRVVSVVDLTSAPIWELLF